MFRSGFRRFQHPQNYRKQLHLHCSYKNNGRKMFIAHCWCYSIDTIWGERAIQSQLDDSVRNKEICTEIAHKLSDLGYSRDWKQCRCKIKNLKTTYKKIKDHNGVTGNGRKTFKFFQQLDEILGHCPASVPEVLLDTQADNQGGNCI